mgnify:CR=1 FL=1
MIKPTTIRTVNSIILNNRTWTHACKQETCSNAINSVATQVHLGTDQHVSSASNAVPLSAARTSSGFSKDSHCVCGAVRALKESAVCMIFE